MNDVRPAIIVEEACDRDLAAMRQRREQFDRNSAWLQEHIAEVYSQHRGKCICVAGQELFVAPTAVEAAAQATSRHPEDRGWFTRYIPQEKASRLYGI